jgi:hypothetical protein
MRLNFSESGFGFSGIRHYTIIDKWLFSYIILPMVKAEIVLWGPKDDLGADDVDIYNLDLEKCKGCVFEKRGTAGSVYCIYKGDRRELRIRTRIGTPAIKQDATFWINELSKAYCQPEIEVISQPWPEGKKVCPQEE